MANHPESGFLIKWMDSEGAGFGDIPVAQGDGTVVWESGQGSIGRPIFCAAFFTGSTPYVSYSSTEWQTVLDIPFPGTDTVVPKLMRIIGSRNAETGLAEVRLFDPTPTALQVIAYITFVDEPKGLYVDSTMDNPPTAPTSLEVQVKKSAPGASAVRLHAFGLY